MSVFSISAISWAYMLSESRSSDIVVRGLDSVVMGSPVLYGMHPDTVVRGLNNSFRPFADMKDIGMKHKFYVEKDDGTVAVNKDNTDISFVPNHYGTYHVGVLHASGYQQVRAERMLLSVVTPYDCLFSASSYASFFDPEQRAQYKDVVVLTYVVLGYVTTPNIVARVQRCADFDESGGPVTFSDVVKFYYAYLGYARPHVIKTESSGVTLLSNLDLDDINRYNDIWGYVSPSGQEYAIIGADKLVMFVRVSDATSPVIVHSHVLSEIGSNWGDYKTYGAYAYAVKDRAADAAGISTFNLTHIDDDIVSIVSTTHQSGDKDGSSHDIAVDEESGYLYYLGLDDSEVSFDVYDIKGGAPVFVSRYLGNTYTHDAQVVTYRTGPYAGRQVMFACSGARPTPHLWIVDVTDKQGMFELAAVSYPGATFSHQVWLDDELRYAYLNDEMFLSDTSVKGTSTIIFNVSDLVAPTFVRSHTSTEYAHAHNNFVSGDYLYQANYDSGLRVFDISDRINPNEVGYFDTSFPTSGPYLQSVYDGAWGVYPYLPSGNILLSDISKGLFVFDVSEAVSGEPAIRKMQDTD